jgi:hypothetical protein
MKAVFSRFVILMNGVALTLCGLALVDFIMHPTAPDPTFHSTLFRSVSVLGFMPLTLLVGFLIIRRVPGNIVGPLLILWSGSVAYLSIRMDIGPVLFALYYYYNLVFGWFGLFYLILHFPDGKIVPQAAARWVYPLAGIDILLSTLIFLSQATLQGTSHLVNPFALTALKNLGDLILGISLFCGLPLWALDVVSPALRYRKGSLLERQQIKWLALFAGFLIIITLLGLVVYPLLTGGPVMSPGGSLPGMLFNIFVGLVPPLAIGLAVLRYRLWDIDRIIRRTLLYAILTFTLGLLYFGSVVLLRQVLGGLAGESNVAIVLSTLLIAALFEPVRRRVQAFIDLRFYRQKYDSALALEEFSAAARHEVGMEQLTSRLVGLAERTLHPEQVWLWMRTDIQTGEPGQGGPRDPFSDRS